MSFTSELEMKQVAKDSLPNCFGIHSDNVISEFDYGMGRTDLVLVNISNDYWDRRKERLNHSKPIIDEQHLISFLYLHGRGPVTKNHFLNSGAQPKRKKYESLEWLTNHKFIKEVRGDKVRTARNLRRHVTTTLAVELKLEKWKNALRQASKGRSFAEYRYVAIDDSYVNNAYSNIGVFKSHNVGLISINACGDVTVHWTPSRGDPYSSLYQWKVNETAVKEITT